VSTGFSRTLRFVEADGFRLGFGSLIVTLVFLAAWAGWFVFAPITLYAVTSSARLEVDREAHAIDAPIAGRVVRRPMQLGQEVAEGDLLVELDAEQTRFQVEEKRAEKTGLTVQLETLRKEIEAQQQALLQAKQAEGAATQEARSRNDETAAAAKFAEEQAARVVRMHEEGLVAESERKRAVAEAEQRRAGAVAQQESLKRMGLDRRLGQSEKRALLAELDRQAADLEGKLTAIDATVARLEHEMGLHQIRAPVAGRLGEVVPLQPGTVVEKGARLGAIVPKGEVRVVAEFSPMEALGRVRPDQKAKLRLEGFPWVQYGSVAATVVEVADETQNGKIRVELVIDRGPTFPVPLTHGLPGTLEVAVEKISPAALVLRGAGRALAQPTQESAH